MKKSVVIFTLFSMTTIFLANSFAQESIDNTLYDALRFEANRLQTENVKLKQRLTDSEKEVQTLKIELVKVRAQLGLLKKNTNTNTSPRVGDTKRAEDGGPNWTWNGQSWSRPLPQSNKRSFLTLPFNCST
jgi:hypothetical protein